MNEHFVINLGRQLGSGGKEIGEKLARELNIAFYDKELIRLASEESGLCKEFFEKADERTQKTFIGALFGNRVPFVGDGAIPYGSCLNNDSLFKIQSDVIRSLAQSGSCLFVGRCADYILRDMECTLNVFLTSPLEVRAARISERSGISLEEAERLAEEKDKKREEYYNYYTFGNWGVASTYDLCLDSSKLEIEGSAEFIIDFARRAGKL
jgi:cytidylate kinase